MQHFQIIRWANDVRKWGYRTDGACLGQHQRTVLRPWVGLCFPQAAIVRTDFLISKWFWGPRNQPVGMELIYYSFFFHQVAFLLIKHWGISMDSYAMIRFFRLCCHFLTCQTLHGTRLFHLGFWLWTVIFFTVFQIISSGDWGSWDSLRYSLSSMKSIC